MDSLEKLERVLPIGKENAIHMEALSKQLGGAPAMSKALVRKARQRGMVICSGQCGYWIPQDDNEKQAFVKSMRKQAKSRFISIKGTVDSLNEIEGEIRLIEALNDISENAAGVEDKTGVNNT